MANKFYAAMAVLMLFAGTALAQSQSQTTPQQQQQGQVQKTNPQENKAPGERTIDQADRQTAHLSSSDRSFVSEASEAGTAEVADGQVALTRASSVEVKAFAQRMVDDHTKAGQELMQLAATKGIGPNSGMTSQTDKKVPEQQDQLKGKARDTMNRLSRLSGTEFDREYMKAQVKDHEKAVSLFEKEAATGSDPDLKAFAEKTLPTLREHLQMARDVASKVGAETKTASDSSRSSQTKH